MSAPTAETKPGAALAKANAPALEFMARNFDDAWRQAELLSKANVVPDALKGKPHDMLIILVTGAELGFSPMLAIREVYVVKGRPFISSALKTAMLKTNPLCEYWMVEHADEKSCTIITKRKGNPKPERHTFTVEEARKADLFKNDVWSKYTATMLRKRCESQLADMVYPDVVRGVGTSDDEMLELQEVRGEVVSRTTTAPPRPSAASPSTSVANEQAPRHPAATEPVPAGFDPVTGVEQEAPPKQAQPSGPPDEYEQELASLAAAIEAATSKEALKGLVERLNALSDKDKMQMRVAYTKKARSLP